MTCLKLQACTVAVLEATGLEVAAIWDHFERFGDVRFVGISGQHVFVRFTKRSTVPIVLAAVHAINNVHVQVCPAFRKRPPAPPRPHFALLARPLTRLELRHWEAVKAAWQ